MHTTLLTIVEVSKENRIRCQAEDCGHPVYKRIHVVDQGGAITVLGSECFKKIVGGYEKKPTYGHSEGVLLSAEEAEMLEKNTSKFIDLQKDKYLSSRKVTDQTLCANEPDDYFEKSPSYEKCVQKIRQEFRLKGMNPDLPGWAGFVRKQAKDLFAELEKKQEFLNDSN